MNPFSDQQLIERTIAGETAYFDQLVERYQDRLIHSLEISLGSREDALEVAQQAFVLAWQKITSFRRESAFYSWLYRIASNVAISQLRRRKINAESLDSLQESTGFLPADQQRNGRADPLEQSEQIDQVRAALQKIPEEFRQPLVLREIDGFSYEEIAEIMQIPLGTVRSRIFRGRQELIDQLHRSMRED